MAFEQLLLLVLFTTLLSSIGRVLPWPAPITYVAIAGVVAWLGAFPAIKLDPDFSFSFSSHPSSLLMVG